MAAGKVKIDKIKSLLKVTAGAGLFFSGFCLYKGDEKFYDGVVMPAVRLLPAELCHNMALSVCKYRLFAKQTARDSKVLTTHFFNREIPNPIGIAAGFDKQGEAVLGLQELGFGFVEIGSVTPEPQPGNPTPRVFRLPEDEAIINRYGFNSDGHQAVYERLRELRSDGKFNGILGVNLGKNKTSPSAVADYVQGVRVFGPLADYLVVNVSSPNTPGLRNLQGKNDLQQLLRGVLEARNQLTENNKVPVLLKISPDMSSDDLKDVAYVINQRDCRVDGLIVSNTTVSRENLKDEQNAAEVGGLSGAPLRSKSTQLIAEVYALTKGKIPIIGVGGISSGRDAYEKLEAGASYLQFYTAFIYHGPPVVSRIKRELADILERNGHASVAEVVGKNYEQYLSK